MRLVTRADFDGLVCGALITKFENIDEYLFVEPKFMQDGLVEIRSGDIITNLPYHPNCTLWFDHHITNTTPSFSQPIMPGKGGEHYIAGVKSFQADVVRSAGGEAVGPEQDRYVPIDAESLIKLNPDMFITAGDPTAFANDPRLKSMPAIAKLKVRGIDADLASRMGYRVDQEINKMHRAISDMAAKNG